MKSEVFAIKRAHSFSENLKTIKYEYYAMSGLTINNGARRTLFHYNITIEYHTYLRYIDKRNIINDIFLLQRYWCKKNKKEEKKTNDR